MTTTTDTQDLSVSHDGHVATVTLKRPPHNYVDADLMERLADTLALLDTDANCRAIVLASVGKAFCAGADFNGAGSKAVDVNPASFYLQAMRLFETRKPIVAAIHGPAIGAGVGLALIADFRIACPQTRFSVNFNRLGFHPGFGLSATLPRLIGVQKASLLFYTGRRIDGAEAVAMHLADELVETEQVLIRAQELAQEIAASAPDAVQSTRMTLRAGYAQEVRAINQRELALQAVQFQSEDFKEGVKAMAERRLPVFYGR